MKINDLRKYWNASNKTKKDIDYVTENGVNIIKNMDIHTFSEFYKWASDTLCWGESDELINNVRRKYCNEVNSIIVDDFTIIQFIERLCNIDYEQANKSIWRCIYNGKINKHEIIKNTSSSVGQRGVVYGGCPKKFIYLY